MMDKVLPQFKGFVNLQELDLLEYGEYKSDLPAAFLHLQSLTKLSIAGAPFKVLLQTLYQMSSLHRLDLWDLQVPFSPDLTKLATVSKLSYLKFGIMNLSCVVGPQCTSRNEVCTYMDSLTKVLRNRPMPLLLKCSTNSHLPPGYSKKSMATGRTL